MLEDSKTVADYIMDGILKPERDPWERRRSRSRGRSAAAAAANSQPREEDKLVVR